MRYSKINNEIIGKPTILPTVYKNIVGFDKLSEVELNNYDFYLYLEEIIDYRKYYFGDLYLSGYTIRKEIISKGLTLSGEKNTKKEEIKVVAYSLLKETDWYIIRNTETSDIIPTGVTSSRSYIRTNCDKFEIEVDNLITIDQVLDYTYDLTNGISNYYELNSV